MADYLQPVGRAWRITSIVGCTLTSTICLLLSLLLWTDMIRRHSLDYEGKPLWVGAAIVGFIGIASAFIAWRLIRRHAAANGVTVMPTWFIQLFGVFVLGGLCFVAYHQGSLLFMTEGVFICSAMILVGRHIERCAWRRHESWHCPQCGSLFGMQKRRQFWSVRRDPHIAGLPTGGPILHCASCQREFAFDGDGRQVDDHREYVERAV